MAWWIVAGLAVVAVVVFAASVVTLLGRIRPLERSLRRLRLRAEQAQRLQVKVLSVRERVVRLRSMVEEIQRRRVLHHQAAPDALAQRSTVATRSPRPGRVRAEVPGRGGHT